MTAPTGHETLIGQRLGRYRITSSLGRGGMAEVFRANDDKLGREVAIKVVSPVYASEGQFLERFQREARLIALLEHPNILPIYDIGEHRGLPYLVMQLVRGGTLADRLSGQPLDPARVVAWVGDLAAALDAAHAAGVLHRDVKPGNVLLGGEERALLADFGIARLCDATRLTRTGTVVGTPVYMAPEVAAGRSAEAAADTYSLAVMIYEMLAGKPPFEGENVLSILHQHATLPVPPITDRVTHLPRGVDGVLERGLAKDPAARPASCRELAELLSVQLPSGGYRAPPASDQLPTLHLRPAAESAPVPSAAPGPTPSAAAADGPSPSGDAYVTLHPPSGGPGQLKQWGLAALLGAVVALVGFLALQAMNPGPAMKPATAARQVPAEADFDAEDPPVATAIPVAAGGGEVGPGTSEAASGGTASGDEALSGDGASAAPVERAAPSDPRPLGVRPSIRTTPSTVGLGQERDPEDRVSEARPVDEAAAAVDVSPGVRHGARPATPRTDRSPFSGMRFHALRSFTSRSTERDFRQAQEAARRLSHKAPNRAQATALQRWAEGGLAYLEGDDATAGESLHEVLRNPRFVAFWGPSPLMLLASSDAERGDFETWELALGYGDPRGSAGAELDRLLVDQPENPRYRFARALVHRLDGEHPLVVRYAGPVFHQLQTENEAEALSYLALIIGDAYLGLDRGDEAFEWYRRAVRVGGPFRGVVALRASEAARETRRSDEALDFLRLACEAGLRPACERLEASARR